jgi:hypothetical protein
VKGPSITGAWHFRYRAEYLRPRPAEVLVLDAFRGHSEVVEAVTDQLEACGILWSAILERHHEQRLTWDPRRRRMLIDAGRLRFAGRRTLERTISRAAADDVPLIVTSDYSGKRHVVPVNLLSRPNLLVLVHNQRRFEGAHGPMAKQPRGIIPACPTADPSDRPQVRLITKPWARVSPWAERRLIRLAVVGHSGNDRQYWERLKALATAVAAHGGFELAVVGRAPRPVVRDLVGLRAVESIGGGGSTDGTELRRILDRSDVLVSLKSPEVFASRWSGTAALAVSHGITLVAPRPMLDAWGLSDAGTIADDGSDPTSLLEWLSRLGHEGLEERSTKLRRVGRAWFWESAQQIAMHFTGATGIAR